MSAHDRRNLRNAAVQLLEEVHRNREQIGCKLRNECIDTVVSILKHCNDPELH